MSTFIIFAFGENTSNGWLSCADHGLAAIFACIGPITDLN
jgi:hypothetical protein